MASELKPIEIAYTNYRGETSLRTITPQRVWFGSTKWHPEPQWLVTAYDHDKQAVRDFAFKDFNTRPAAPVEGLETLSVEMLRDYAFMKADPDGDYVTRSQAEAIIAAERAKVQHWQEQYTEMHSQFIDLAKSAEADNAALTARVKELEQVVSYEIDVAQAEIEGRKEAEAKLAAAEKSLEPFADIADLINAETEGMAETDELVLHFHDYEFAKWPVSFFRKARAVLGGKPS